jgi:YD repeat-containing protein
MMSLKCAACYCIHDDCCHLASSISSLAPTGPALVFVSRVPWNGPPGDREPAARVAAESGAEVVLGEWRSELEHRRAALAYLREKGFTHALIPDGDEVIDDNTGNLTEVNAAGSRTTYVYDHENRLTGLRFPNGTRSTYTYAGGFPAEGEGLRRTAHEAGGSLTTFVWDGSDYLGEY